jgi:flagellar biosynthesis protein FlhG
MSGKGRDDAPDPEEDVEAQRELRTARLRGETADESIEEEVEDSDEGLAELPSLTGEIDWSEEHGGPFVVAFVGGKGGAGASLVAANVAVFLSRLGREVVVVDAAAGGSNLHTYLGVDPLLPSPASLLRSSGAPRLERVPGMSLRLCRPPRPLTGPDEEPRRGALDAALALEDADVVVLDLGAQADPITLDAFLAADAGVVVVLPEPAGIERTYAFLREALFRRLLSGDDRPAAEARALLEADDADELGTPARLAAALATIDADAADAIRARVLAFTPHILLNQCRSRADTELLDGIVSALRRRWGISAEPLAALEYDDAAWHSARRRKPVLIEYPGSGLAERIERMARRLLGLAARHAAKG